jgi:hypothetical protein
MNFIYKRLIQFKIITNIKFKKEKIIKIRKLLIILQYFYYNHVKINNKMLIKKKFIMVLNIISFNIL